LFSNSSRKFLNPILFLSVFVTFQAKEKSGLSGPSFLCDVLPIIMTHV